MSETIPDPAPIASVQPDAEFTPPARPVTRRPMPLGGILGLIVLLFLLGAGGGYYLFHREASAQRGQAALAAEISALQARTASLAARVATLRNTPPPPPVVQIPAALSGEIDGLRRKLKALSANIATDHATIATDHASIASLRSGSQSRLDGLEAKLASLQSSLGNLPKLAAKARRLDRLAIASLALQEGAPLGSIKNAPPALARYASKAPPTEAALRRAFPEAARRAATASGDAQAASGYWQRLKMRVAGLVTLRKGGHVLIGSTASGILATARDDLDNGDLPGAVAALDHLPSPAKAAMRSWLDQANGLLAARQALGSMAGAA
jgi:hypothetical protein